ncbi:MAG: hypothetical protein K2I63_03695, partial [Helicobacter sp.]|nr:hypothetical protein [Helicobacter sp.]
MTMPTQPTIYDLLLFSTSNPLKIGVYAKNRLIESFFQEGQISDILIPLFDKISTKYPNIQTLFFVNGPGSLMALKLVYIFAKTLAMAKGIKLQATNGFAFNGNHPIKAYGTCYFVCDKTGKISIQSYESPPKCTPYILPKILDTNLFSKDINPLYLMP